MGYMNSKKKKVKKLRKKKCQINRKMNFNKVISKSLSLNLIVVIKVGLIIYQNKIQNNILLNYKIRTNK